MRLTFARDHEANAEVACQRRVVLVGCPDAIAADAVMIDGDGLEIGRGDTMPDALETCQPTMV